jgi:hypothetical protein
LRTASEPSVATAPSFFMSAISYVKSGRRRTFVIHKRVKRDLI